MCRFIAVNRYRKFTKKNNHGKDDDVWERLELLDSKRFRPNAE